MPKYVAFLRAINVGGHTVKMDYLRTLFEALGFTNVETFIASGNVIFDSPSRSSKALEKRIEASLELTLGYAVATFIRSTSELAEVASYTPFSDAKLNSAHALYIGFMAATPSDAAQQKLLALDLKMDEFQLNGREIYWLRGASFSDSEFSGARLEKTLGLQATMRNVTTVKKLAAKYSMQDNEASSSKVERVRS
ncbi:MAG TPA: DUF1697 domain-containing protein [Pyrinomonadaceae bacterium]|jgi:uncharacterized protein (DUF1697 family)|nr:DUF1697 domain-containing protein [Pyrinomonadaceae bacterium]